ncbi:MAG: sensor histidine kinase [Cytophagales bacterium]|nr:MAG: sensor histidine kinase [Cytophagales bacterium]
MIFEDDYVCISFEDNGIGIKEEYIKKIFDMFFRATDKGEGSGLGLYIVKQTIEKLGGSIEVKSEYGEGTLMTIHLPNLLK